ncbi:MAG: regulatory protein RecX [Alcanivorax sp.]
MTQNNPEAEHITHDAKNFKRKKERRPPKKITERYLHNSALFYLERFAASKKHFITVMMRKVKKSCMHHKDQDFDACEKMVHALADKFEKNGLLNDTLYTDSLVNSMRRKGLSTNGIVTKMMVKGIAKEKTLDALERLDNENHENRHIAEKMAAITFARKRKIGPFFRGAPEDEDQTKSLAKIARAGFSYDIAKSVLEMTHQDAEDALYENIVF